MEDGYYVFSRSIDVSNYESRGGMDLLQKKIDRFTHLSKPIITSGNEVNIDGEKTGYYVTNETEIVDLAASTTSKEFKDQLNAEYDRVFNSGQSVSQKQDYLYSIGIADDITSNEWQDLGPSGQKQRINNALTEHLFEGRFPGLANPSEKINQVSVLLKEGDEKSEQLLAAAMEQGIKNPLTNSDYKIGDTIYVKETQTSRDKRDDGQDDAQVLGLYKLLQDKGRVDVKKQLVNVPISIKNRGKFLVDKSGQFRLVSGTDPRLYPIVSDDNFFEALNDAVKTE